MSSRRDPFDPQAELVLPAGDPMQLLQQIVERLNHAVVLTDAERAIIYVNPAYERLTGYRSSEVIGIASLPGPLRRAGEQEEALYEQIWHALDTQRYWEGELWDRHANGSPYLKHMMVERIEDGAGNTSHYIAIFHNITEKNLAEEELERLLHYDPLTNLPNRLLFRNRLQHEFQVARRHRSHAGVILLNLDRFQQLNETFGYNTGDRLLKEIASRLEECIRSTDLVARQQERDERDPDLVSRMGGDDFAFILSEIRKPEDAALVAERLLNALAPPFVVDDEEIFVSASMGIAIYPQNATSSDELLHCAEKALFQTKASGPGSYRFFAEENNLSSAQRVRLETALRRGIQQQEFALHYQPQVDLATGRVSGVEALLRWPQSDGAMRSPAEFIPIAEDTGLIIPLGRWVLQQALADILAIEQQTAVSLRISVNLSARQFQHPSLLQEVAAALEHSGIDPARLELEITESMLMHHLDEARATMGKLRALGTRLAIDDFGTGYSSLAYLQEFPVNTLKIDRRFVSAPSNAQTSNCIVCAVIGLGHGLGLEVVAEGIESEAQLVGLQEASCDVGQGYHLGRPMPMEALIALLQDRAAD